MAKGANLAVHKKISNGVGIWAEVAKTGVGSGRAKKYSTTFLHGKVLKKFCWGEKLNYCLLPPAWLKTSKKLWSFFCLRKRSHINWKFLQNFRLHCYYCWSYCCWCWWRCFALGRIFASFVIPDIRWQFMHFCLNGTIVSYVRIEEIQRYKEKNSRELFWIFYRGFQADFLASVCYGSSIFSFTLTDS